MENAPLIAEIKRRVAIGHDPLLDQILKELNVLYATIGSLSRLSTTLEREAEVKRRYDDECV
jgi:hypothetical protein